MQDIFGIQSITTNELHIKNVGSGANLNPWAGEDSASRAQMVGSHISQIPVIAQPSIRRTLTGTEREYGRYTFKQCVPENGRFVQIIDKYPTGGLGRYHYNPQKIAVYRGKNSKYGNAPYYGAIDLTTYHSKHQYFGWLYRPVGHRLNLLQEGGEAVEGMVLSQSPSIDEHENYRMGVSSKIVYLSLHTTIEDGVLANREWLQRFKSIGIESRVGSWGDRCYPLNLYCDGQEYRSHPEIGDRIADHGVVFAVREYDELLAVVEMTPAALREIDYVFDRLTYAKPNAEVIDITVFHDHNLDRVNNEERTPAGIDAQSKRYYEQYKLQQKKLVDLYESLKRQHGDNLVLQPSFHRMIKWAYAFTNRLGTHQTGGKVNLMFRRAPIGDFRTEVVFKYDIVPSVGSKVTNLHGCVQPVYTARCG